MPAHAGHLDVQKRNVDRNLLRDYESFGASVGDVRFMAKQSHQFSDA
jgi:hypothetical protein